MTLVAATYQDVPIDLNNKKDIYVYGISYRFGITPSDLIADEKVGLHVSRRDLGAITLDKNTPICIESGLVTAVGSVKLADTIVFSKPYKYSNVDKLYIGALSGGAGSFSCVLLISEKDIAY